MKPNFKTIIPTLLAFLGIEAFSKDDKGQEFLADDQ
jgi:hypothetical protein